MGGTGYVSEDFTVEVGSSSGLVSSIDVSGGASGLVFTGGPVTTSGTITLASGQLVAGYGGTGLTSFTAGPVVFGATATALGQDTALWWDNTNKRLGIGTSSPAQQFVTSGKAIFGSAITGSAIVAAPAISWQFGDLSANATTLGGANNFAILYNSNVALPVGTAAQYGLGIAPQYTGSGGMVTFGAAYFDSWWNTAGQTALMLMGTYSRSILANSSGTSTAVVMNGLQAVVQATNGATKTIGSANGVLSTLTSTGATTNISLYTSFRADNSTAPSDGGYHQGSVDGGVTIGAMKGFYYTPPGITPTTQAAFQSDLIPDSTGALAQYQLYMPGTITWTTGAGGWYVNAGSGKNYFGGRVGIGTVSPESPLEVASTLGTYTTSPSSTWPNGATITQYGGAAPATLFLRTTQGAAKGAEVLANNGDCVGQIAFAGYNNTTRGYPPTAIIAARMDQTPTAGGNSPTGLEMWTGLAIGTVNGAAYGLPMQGAPYYGLPYKRMTLDSSGVQTLYDQPYCLATQTAGQSINSGSITDLQFNINSYYQGDPSRGGTLIHDTATNNTRFTAPRSGVYMMVARITFPANATGVRSIFISKSGLGTVAQTTNTAPSGAITCVLEATALVSMTAGEYLIVSGYQTSGGALTNTSGIGITDASIVKVA